MLLSPKLTAALQLYLKHSEEEVGLVKPAGYSPNKGKEARREARRDTFADILERDRKALNSLLEIASNYGEKQMIDALGNMEPKERVTVLRALLEMGGGAQANDGEVTEAIKILKQAGVESFYL